MIGRCIAAALSLAIATPSLAQSADSGANFLKAEGKSFVLENARLVDGTGSAARTGVTVVIDKGVITHVGGKDFVAPAGAIRIDLGGHTILPGLVMMHEHINYFSGAYVWDSQPGSVPKLLLAAGITAVRTAGGEAPQVDLNLKQRIDAGRAPGPRLFVTGAYLNGPEGGFLGDTVVRTAAEAREIAAFWGARGATSMKVYSAISPDALRGAVEEANRRGMHVAGHLGEISCTEAAEAGIHTIEHTLTSCAKDLGVTPEGMASFRYDPSSDAAKKLIALLVAKKVVMISTPAMTDGFEASEEEVSMLSPDQRRRRDEFVSNPPPWYPLRAELKPWDRAHRDFERHFVASGGRLLVGGDASDFGVVPGYANHNAMVALVEAGFTPLQVIRFATSDAAEFLGADQLGSVAVGKAAGLLVVKGAPDQRIGDIRNVAYVFKDGQAFDPAKLCDAAKGQLGLH